MFIEDKELQLSNADLPIYLTVLGTLIEVIESQLSKAWFSMYLTELGMVTVLTL